MKKLNLLVIMLLMISSITFAQTEKKPKAKIKARIENRTNIMAKELALDDEQKTAVFELNTKWAKQIWKARKSCKKEECGKDEAKKMLKKINAKYNKQLKSILTPEQFKKYKALKKEMFKRRRKAQRGK